MQICSYNPKLKLVNGIKPAFNIKNVGSSGEFKYQSNENVS